MQTLQKNSGSEKRKIKECMDKLEKKYQQGRSEPDYIKITLKVRSLTF